MAVGQLLAGDRARDAVADQEHTDFDLVALGERAPRRSALYGRSLRRADR